MPRSRRAGAQIERDQGPEETEWGLPARFSVGRSRHETAPDESGAGIEGFRLLSFLLPLSLP